LCRELRREIGGKNAGFTILEVLVAITIMVTTLSAIGLLSGASTRGVRSLEQHVALIETARSVIASVPSPTQLTSHEDIGELYGSRWRISASPFLSGVLVPESPWVPVKVSIRVQSPSGAALNFETIRLQRKRE
jgi:general secretion pathway protein I